MVVKLMQFIEMQLYLPLVKVSFCTDSSVALALINSESRTLKPFAENRVASIQESTEINQWNHDSGKEILQILLLEISIFGSKKIATTCGSVILNF